MAPPQGQMRPGRQLALLGAIFVILASLAWFGGKGGFSDRLAPQLGLDLVGGSRVTLKAVTDTGAPPKPEELEQARQIIQQRVDSLNVAEAQVVTQGNNLIVIQVAKKENDAIRDVGQASQMFFRKVLNTTDGSGAATAPVPTPTVSASAKPSASASAKPSASGTPSPKASGSGGGGAMAAAPSATPSASASAAASPAAQAEGPVTEAQVQAKVGKAAWDAAKALTAVPSDPAAIQVLKPFADLTPAEINALPVEIQYYVPQVTCDKLDARVAGSIRDASKKAVACDGTAKNLLDIAKVAGTDVDTATAGIEQGTSRWVVNLTFSGEGQDKWTELTKEAFNNSGDPKCDPAAVDTDGRCRVAVVLDNTILSAPAIQGVLTDRSQITGDFTVDTAKALADGINYGSLAMTFERQETQTITATLGGEHLQAGLLAAGIGLLLVVIYSFFYYRLLGTVITLSLVLSAVLTFLALVVLGRTMGFTLTLAGIAGFIVSLGVAADSFVIYFERLKDEIREGRAPRSAVQRAWTRARRTILTANAISLLAALVLYLVSTGAVAGFAFALGLATLIDLIVVFLFRYPIMALFARTDAFLSPRVSGLGRVLHEAKEAKA
ncbi:protein translocase subunit SecD [Catellatospora sp. KI3]|uniref:protein translocase subunit SecD n=1 Tax=Catellatospora sp. KI3 TaxID=3041620 RepID=UPI002482A57F|nr:protein translocase subunit SecD [Catellatospora sp. KI3]MDI1462335.1 protein translocase subunit SecD [Catellatospora sp. KI3]